MAHCSTTGAYLALCKKPQVICSRRSCVGRLHKLPGFGGGFVRQERGVTRCYSAVETVSEAEDEANKKRWQESGKGAGDSNEWKWTLNWDSITDNIIVGSCPRAPEDLDRIVDEAGATAVLSLQCDLCLEALGIDWYAIRDRGVERGIVVSRVPIRDFDHGDQTLMLPEAVRTLAMLLALNNKVYVHCTAGINRATLTTLGYLTFVQGWELHSAVKMIKKKRSQAHPYVDCWKSTKARILHARTDEVVAVARKLSMGNHSEEKDSFSHWIEAENCVVTDTFKRQLATSLSLVSSLTDIKAASLSSVCILPEEMEKANEEISSLKLDLERERVELHNALAVLGHEAVGGVGNKRTPKLDNDESIDSSSFIVFEGLAEAKKEIEALKQAMRDMAEISARALSGELAADALVGALHDKQADSVLPDVDEKKEEQE